MYRTSLITASLLMLLCVVLTACGDDEKMNTQDRPGSPGDEVSQAKAFITSESFKGDLMRSGGGATGLEGADNLCQQAAESAGLEGTFRAWISDSTTHAIDRLSDVGGWFSTGPEPYLILESKDQIATGGYPAPFQDEMGVRGFGEQETWTGTQSDGTKTESNAFIGTSTNCNDWTTGSQDSGTTGLNGTQGRWSESAAYQCQNRRALYCFQQ